MRFRPLGERSRTRGPVGDGFGEIRPGQRGRVGGHLLRRALRQKLSASGAALGAEFDHPVGGPHQVEIVLDHHHRVAELHQLLERVQELSHVVEMESGGGLVQQVEGLAGAGTLQLGGELDALGLAAREGGGGLAELHVVEADLREHGQTPVDLGVSLEELQRLAHRHVQHVGDGAPLVVDLQGGGVEALTAALLAFHLHVGQKLHLHFLDARSLAILAAPPFDVKGEAARLVAAGLGFRERCVELSDLVEDAGVGGRVGARGAADGALVDLHHRLQVL